MPTLETNRLLAVAVDACDSKKAEDVRILALDPSESALTDYFLICSGTNERQNGAIADEIEHRLKQEFGVYANSVEGRRQGEWILLDYVDFVVHIFMPEKRAFYGLERLRKSAKSLTPADLNDEIKAAIASTRAKHKGKKRVVPSPKADDAREEIATDPAPDLAAEEETEKPQPKRSKAGKRASSKVADALKPAAAKKAAAKKSGSKAATKTKDKKSAAAKSKSGKPGRSMSPGVS